MIKRILISVSLLVAAPAMAVVDTWEFASDDRNFTGTGFGNVFTVDNDTGSTNALDKISISGWSDTGNNNAIETGELSYDTRYGLMLHEQNNGSNTVQHSIDSFGGNFDMVLVSFEQAINLSEFSIDWRREAADGNYSTRDSRSYASQADISVAAYEGTGSITTLAGVDKWDAIAAPNSGWTTVGRYADVDSGADIAYQTVTTAVESKYWLIGAYNPIFTGGEAPASGLGTGWKDAFKLASVAGTYADTPPPGIPEPASIFLFATALFGLISTKRSKANI